MKHALRLLEIPDGIERYKQIYNFQEPLAATYVAADNGHAEKIIGNLKKRIKYYKMNCTYPNYIGPRRIDRSHLGQTTLHSYLI